MRAALGLFAWVSLSSINNALAQSASPPAAPQNVPDGVVYNYQTLIGALIALAVGAPTILLMWRQLRQQYHLKTEASLALCRMFFEELKIYARFFIEINADLQKAISEKLPQIAELRYPESIVFSSQNSRLSEIDPTVALGLMYFYQSVAHLQRLGQRSTRGLTDHDAKSLAEAYKLTLTKLDAVMQVTVSYLQRGRHAVSVEERNLLNLIQKTAKQ